MGYYRYLVPAVLMAISFTQTASANSFLSSPNVPLDSPIYLYLEKLAGFGDIVSDFKGIRPYSRSEVARLLKEAESRLDLGESPPLAGELIDRIKELIPREDSLYNEPETSPPLDYNPASNARLRYVYLDGAPRNYTRVVRDPGGDWDFPLPAFRPHNPYPGLAQQRGTEGTPLSENNEGIIYGQGHNGEARWSSEAYIGSFGCALIEPLLLWSGDAGTSELSINKGYLKAGGGAVELEVGRDENWLGLGYRGAITLSDNAPNLTSVKLSSPEPFISKYLWDLKYDLVLSQLDKTVVNGQERQPYFYAIKLSFKPSHNLEFGLSLGRQVGGPGVDNSFLATTRGLVGATTDDNSKSNAGVEFRYRLAWLRNSEIFGEISGCDRQWFWPKAQSYLTGFFIPSLTASGRDDLRFEYFHGHQILYTGSTFPSGYIYHNFPIGDSQGGATEDFFLRYSHWFSARKTFALECFRTTRGEIGLVPVDPNGNFDPNGVMQATERKVSLRAFFNFPVYAEWNADLMYGWETISNWNLEPGVNRTNQLLRADLTYHY